MFGCESVAAMRASWRSMSMNAWSWFIDGRIRLMTMSFSKPADAPLDGEEELGHAAGRELADERVLAELARKPCERTGHASAPASILRAPSSIEASDAARTERSDPRLR